VYLKYLNIISEEKHTKYERRNVTLKERWQRWHK